MARHSREKAIGGHSKRDVWLPLAILASGDRSDRGTVLIRNGRPRFRNPRTRRARSGRLDISETSIYNFGPPIYCYPIVFRGEKRFEVASKQCRCPSTSMHTPATKPMNRPHQFHLDEQIDETLRWCSSMQIAKSLTRSYIRLEGREELFERV